MAAEVSGHYEGQRPLRGGKDPGVPVQQRAAHTAMLRAPESGVTAGIDETHFAPSQTCTRGQVVTFLCSTLTP